MQLGSPTPEQITKNQGFRGRVPGKETHGPSQAAFAHEPLEPLGSGGLLLVIEPPGPFISEYPFSNSCVILCVCLELLF